jgi:hypothetical protein
MTEGRRTTIRTEDDSLPVSRTRRGAAPAEADRIADLEARLAKLEKAPGLRERGRGVMARVVPDEATQHFRNAGREQLLGVRSIVDFWIERIDEAEGRSSRRTRRESIEID